MTPFYSHGNVVLFNADCLDVLPMLPAQSINLVLCDLPYGVSSCSWDTPLPLDVLWREWKRLLVPNGAVVLTAVQPFTTDLINSNRAWFRYEWIWEKSNVVGFLDAKRKPLKAHENVLVFYAEQPTYHPQTWRAPAQFIHNHHARTKSYAAAGYGKQQLRGPRLLDTGERQPRSVLPVASVGNPQHPTEKPVDLFAYFIDTYTNPGDTVLDHTCGIGTTLVAAKHLHRRAIGVELSPEYCAVAVRRLQQEVMALAV